MYFLWDSSFSPEKNPAVTCLERWACGWCSGGPVPSPLTSTFSTSWVCCLSSISPKNKPLVCLEVGMWDALWFGCIKWAQWLLSILIPIPILHGTCASKGWAAGGPAISFGLSSILYWVCSLFSITIFSSTFLQVCWHLYLLMSPVGCLYPCELNYF